jgi:HEPN domain-containing protein
MNEETVKKWIIKAGNDFKTGKDELSTDAPATDTVCFHMQQCVEKYLKAYRVFHGEEISKTHDISELIQLCAEIDPDFEKLYQMKTDELTMYAVDIRYPDDFYMPTLKEAEESIKIAIKAKNFIGKKLKDK